MKSRKTVISPEARHDLISLYEWVSSQAGSALALSYIRRVETFIRSLNLASERGRARDDLRQGLRIFGFERKLTVAFAVREETVTVLRVFRKGRNWEIEFKDSLIATSEQPQ